MFRSSRVDKSEILERMREWWLKTRARGKQRFILLWGVLGWGAWMFIFTSAINIFGRHEKLGWFLPFSLLIWMAVGYGFGSSMWNHFEDKYGPSSTQRLRS
jgi:hypothetical protein